MGDARAYVSLLADLNIARGEKDYAEALYRAYEEALSVSLPVLLSLKPSLLRDRRRPGLRGLRRLSSLLRRIDLGRLLSHLLLLTIPSMYSRR